MGAVGMPVASCTLRRGLEMEVFLLTLELGGVAIVLIGLRRERWLRQRRR